MTQLAGKVALITGGTQGIGYTIAEQFLREGAVVAITGRDQAKTEAAAAALAAATGGTCLGYKADVSKGAEVEALFAGVQERFKQLNVVVNNAGITKDGLLMRMSEEDWDDVLATNLKGAFLCCKAACRPLLKAKGGAMINCVSSVVGVAGQPGPGQLRRQQGRPDGPDQEPGQGAVQPQHPRQRRGPRLHPYGHDRRLDGRGQKALLDQIPLGRFGEVPARSLPPAAILLRTPPATSPGQVLRVDGGMMM